MDWNDDDEAIDPSTGDAYGNWPGVEGIGISIPNEWDVGASWAPEDDDEEDIYLEPLAPATTDSRSFYEIDLAFRTEIDSLWDSKEYVAARELILSYLASEDRGKYTGQYTKLLYASYFDGVNLLTQNLLHLWQAVQLRLVQSKIRLAHSDAEKLRESIDLLQANFNVDAFDASVQSSSILRKEFKRSDLALTLLEARMAESVPNSPHFNATLLATYLDLQMVEDAETVAHRLMKFANVVDGALKYALPVYTRFLLTKFEQTGDFDYAAEAKVMIDGMPMFEIDDGYYLRCLMRYQTAIGERLAAHETRQRIESLSQPDIRRISPSAGRNLSKKAVDDLNASLPIANLSRKLRSARSVQPTLDEALNAYGITGAKFVESERRAHKNWFFHAAVNMPCPSGLHNVVMVFRSHYSTQRLEKSQSAHYMAVYCCDCNVVSFTTLDTKEYFEECRRLCEKVASVKDLCIDCKRM